MTEAGRSCDSAAMSPTKELGLRTVLVLSLVVFAACRSTDVVEPVEPVEPAEPVVVLEPFESDDGPMGYRDASGKVHIAAQYDFATDFTPEGIAWVAGADGLAWIDRSGKTLAKAFAYDNGADPFVEGRARIVDNGRMGFIDPNGRVVVEATFDFLRPMKNGRASFCKGCVEIDDGEHSVFDGGEWGFIDADGVVLPAD